MERLNPKAVWVFFARFVFAGIPFFVFFALFLIRSGFAFRIGWLIIVGAAYLLLCFGWANLTYRFWRYQMAEKAFKKEHGVIWKKYVSIPYGRIQNVDIRRGVIERLLGLSSLQIQTAGYSFGGKKGIRAEGYLPGLSREKAEEIRESLVNRVREENPGL